MMCCVCFQLCPSHIIPSTKFGSKLRTLSLDFTRWVCVSRDRAVARSGCLRRLVGCEEAQTGALWISKSEPRSQNQSPGVCFRRRRSHAV